MERMTKMRLLFLIPFVVAAAAILIYVLTK